LALRNIKLAIKSIFAGLTVWGVALLIAIPVANAFILDSLYSWLPATTRGVLVSGKTLARITKILLSKPTIIVVDLSFAVSVLVTVICYVDVAWTLIRKRYE